MWKGNAVVTALLHILHLHDENRGFTAGYVMFTVFIIIIIVITEDDYFSSVHCCTHQRCLAHEKGQKRHHTTSYTQPVQDLDLVFESHIKRFVFVPYFKFKTFGRFVHVNKMFKKYNLCEILLCVSQGKWLKRFLNRPNPIHYFLTFKKVVSFPQDRKQKVKNV